MHSEKEVVLHLDYSLLQDVTPCSLVDEYKCISIYQTTNCPIQEDHNLDTHHRQNIE
jgi:hypothetical protein